MGTLNMNALVFRITVFAVLLVIVCFQSIAASKQISPNPNLPDALNALTPPGWEVYGKVKQFNKNTLYQQINGRADLFIAYDMHSMTFVSYADKTNPLQFIDISVYDMGTPTNAFGIFSSERSPELPPIRLGRESYRTDASYFIWKGQYYVRIVPSEVTKKTDSIGYRMAEKLTNALTDTGEPVWGLTAMPKKDLVPASIQFYKENAMGLDFMTNTYTALYRKDKSEIMAFLSRQTRADSVHKMADLYAAYARDFGNGVKRLTSDNIELYLCDMDGSFDIYFKKGRLFGGVSSIEDKDLAIRAAIELWHSIAAQTSASFQLLHRG
jgi:hypothetical protein